MDSPVMASDLQAKKKNVANIKRHILFCVGEKCCTAERGLAVWTYLKQQMAQHGISEGPASSVYRTKVGCLRICADGPIAVVYPEGTWYRFVDERAVDEIIVEHLINGRPVVKYQFSQTNLAPSGTIVQGAST